MGNAKRYRKRPVLIEAMQVTSDGIHEGTIEDWTDGHARFGSLVRSPLGDIISAHMLIQTLEGTMRADLGDYVIRGVQGEFYPCKPDIFKATYQEVSPDDEQQ